MNTEIRIATEDDLVSYYDFLLNHSLESKKGSLIFRYSETPWTMALNEFITDKKNRWGKTLIQTGWEKAWILTDNNKVFGHLVLQHSSLIKTNLHRANLNMGIIESYRNKKFGLKLLELAIQWSKNQKDLQWLQLSVFSHNAPAINLYKKVGFVQVGLIQDCVRVFNQSIDETIMTLKLNQ